MEELFMSLTKDIELWLASAAPRDDWSKYWADIDKLKQDRGTSLRFGLTQLESNEVAKRVVAANLLGQLCNPVEDKDIEDARTIVKHLSIAATKEDDEACLEAIADALRFPGIEDAREALLLLSESQFDDVRMNATQALGSILESDGVLTKVKELCEDEYGEVRNWALFHLVVEAEWRVEANEELDSSWPDIFASHTDDSNMDARSEALEGLALYKDNRGIDPLLEELKKDTVTGQNIRSAGIYENSIFLEPLLVIEKKFGGDEELTEAIEKSR